MTTRQRKPLTDLQLREFFRLVSGADTVELKLTVPDTDQRSTILALGIDPLDAQLRQVFFFDTPDLALDKAGVVLRARRIQGKGGDTVVKLRPVEPDELSKELRHSAGVSVEVDAMPGEFVCSASFKGTCGLDEPRAVQLGEAPIRSLFTKGQREFYREHAPDGLRMRDLTVLGPITLLKVRFSIREFSRPIVGEMWLYPDGSRVLELSTKCATTEAFQVAAEVRGALGARGVNLGGEQQTKTRAALEYFSKLKTA